MRGFFLILWGCLIVCQALAQTTPQPQIVQSTAAKSVYVDRFTGSALYVIPLTLPAARKSLSFGLNLVYSSHSGNGWLGVGWRLDLGFIERSTKKGSPRYNSTDTYLYSLNQSQGELVGVGGQEYRPKIEDRAVQFIFDGQSWIARDGSGITYYFGLAKTFSDFSCTTNPSNPAQIFRWRLSKITDKYGNSVVFKYRSDRIEIYYTEKTSASKGSFNKDDYNYSVEIRFSDTRPGRLSSCRPGFLDDYPLNGKGIIETISIFCREEIVRKFVFGYVKSKKTFRSLLETVTEYASDGITANPPVHFVYSASDIPRSSNYQSIVPHEGDKLWNIHLAVTQFSPESIKNRVDSISPDGTRLGIQYRDPISVTWGPTHTQSSGQENGFSWQTASDGNLVITAQKGQVIHAWTYVNNSVYTQIKNPKNSSSFSRTSGTGVPFFVEGEWEGDDYFEIEGGYTKIEFLAYNFERDYQINLGFPLASMVQKMSSQPVSILPLPHLSGDFNGDGLTDLGIFNKEKGYCDVAVSDGVSFRKAVRWIDTFALAASIILGDFDGDGKTDLCAFVSQKGEFRVALSEGNKFVNKGVWLTGFAKGQVVNVGDFNGDGITDLCTFFISNSALYCQAAFSDGSRFFPQPQFQLLGGLNYSIPFPGVGDFNADGISDFFVVTDLSYRIIGYNALWSTPKTWPLLRLNPPEYKFLDYDFDGRSELLLTTGSNSSVVLYDWRRDPMGFGSIASFESRNLGEDAQVQVGDFNGDGIVDFLAYDSIGHSEMCLSDPQLSTAVDLLASVENGWGASMAIDYYHAEGVPCYIPVVSSLTIRDGLGDVDYSHYDYYQAVYNAQEKEFRGFGKVTVSDDKENRTLLYFLQDEIFRGKLSGQQMQDNNGSLISEIKNTWFVSSQRATSSIISLKETTQIDYDTSDNTAQKKVSFEYDTYGNQTRQIEDGEVDQTGDERETVTEYAYNTVRWLVNYPWHISVKDARGKRAQEKWFYYDSTTTTNIPPAKGTLTQEEVLVENPVTGESVKAKTYYTYDDFGNVKTITDPLDHTLYFDYDTRLHTYPAVISDALGHITQYTYDDKIGKPLMVIDANNQKTAYKYDVSGRLLKIIGPNDTEDNPGTSYDYAISDKKIILSDSFEKWSGSSGLISQWRTDIVSFASTLTMEELEKTSGRYSMRFASTWVFDQEFYSSFYNLTFPGKQVRFSCQVKTSAPGRIRLSISDYPINSSFESYSQFHPGDNKWHLLVVTAPLNQLNIFYAKIIISGGDRQEIVSYFDDAEVSVFSLSGGLSKITEKTKISDTGGVFNYTNTLRFYDALGRLVQKKDTAEPDPVSGTSRQIVSDTVSYNQSGQVQEKYLPYFCDSSELYNENFQDKPKVLFTYDCLGRQIRMDNPDGTYFQTTYFARSLQSRDENSHIISNFFDAYGRKSKIEEYNEGAVYSTRYEYDTLNNLTKITDDQKNVTQFFYDSTGRMIELRDSDRGIWKYEYDLAGNLKKQVDGRGKVIDFEYDELNRIKFKKSAGTTLASYTYDEPTKEFCIGRLSKISYPAGSEEYFYDKLGRQKKLVETIAGESFTIERTYDALGRTETLKYPDATLLQYTYSPQGVDKITDITDPKKPKAFIADLSYSAASQVTKETFGNGVVTNYDYYPETLRLKQILTYSAAKKIQDLNYFFDNVGNIQNIQDYVNSSSQSFLYDDLNRLVQAQGAYGSFTYTYDSLGNILNKEGVKYSYDRVRPHALDYTSGGISFEYDDNGNLLRTSTAWNLSNKTPDLEKKSGVVLPVDNTPLARVPPRPQKAMDMRFRYRPVKIAPVIPVTTEYIYDLESRLIRIEETSGNTKNTLAEFSYNSQGSRVKKDGTGKTTYYLGSLFEKDSDGTTRKHIFLGATRVCSISSLPGSPEAISYYHPDHLGSSNVVSDKNGNQAQLSEYTPFGAFSKNSVIASPAGEKQSPVSHYFTGKELDASTGLYYYGARYYNPGLGRFIQIDPLIQDRFDPQSLNPYAYCRNNPLVLTDPEGASWQSTWSSISSGISSGLDSISNWATNTLNSLNAWVTHSWATITNKEFQQGYGSGLSKGIITGSIGIIGVTVATTVFPELLTAGIAIKAGYALAAWAGVGMGFSTGAAITGMDLLGNPLSLRQRGELAGSATLGWGLLGLGAREQFRTTGQLFNYPKLPEYTAQGGVLALGRFGKNRIGLENFAEKYNARILNQSFPKGVSLRQGLRAEIDAASKIYFRMKDVYPGSVSFDEEYSYILNKQALELKTDFKFGE